jgi:hypothetical protein
MLKLNFFSTLKEAAFLNKLLQSSDMGHILSHAHANSLVFLDIDDTIGRVPQTLGLDAWFRFRIQQYANEGHTNAQALASAVEIYNAAQLASICMVPLHEDIRIAPLIEELKSKNIKVLALTARNNLLTEKTLTLLKSMDVHFSDDVLKEGHFLLNNKPVEIKNGVVFANGNNKGVCLEQLVQLGHFETNLLSYKSVTFVDDSLKNCTEVAESLEKMQVPEFKVWHYNYAETYLPFTEQDKTRSAIQERYLLEHQILLNNDEADGRLARNVSI